MTQAGHVLIDGCGLLLSVDRGFGDIMRSEPAALVGRSVDAMTAPADRQECGVALATLRATHRPFVICKRFLRDDGSLVWVNNTVSMVEGRDADLMVATVAPVIEPDAMRAPALLLDCARLMVALRSERSARFSSGLFTDRAWDVMLSAYIGEAEGRAVTAATLTSDLGLSTAQADRWIVALLGERAIEIETRESDPLAPKGFRLTGATHARLEDYLSNASRLQGGLIGSPAEI